MQTFVNNRYRIVNQLGKGGMGTVYLVEDVLHNNSRLALKTIRADLLLERNLTQFKYEFAALGQLRHPNLVEVYDFGVIADSNEYFFTMEYVPGKELPAKAEEFQQANQNDYSWLFDTVVQICRVLQYIHSRGFIHYDVKPRNVRVMADGTVKLMDFGLVGEVRGAGQLKVRGTPEYIAPELIRGGQVDHRVDLYSLGVSLYEIVTGHPPFTGSSSLIILRQHVENTPEPPRHFVHDLPEHLQTLILKLMAKEPVNRFSSAESVIQAVNHLTHANYPVETKETKRGYIQSGNFVGRAFEMARLQGVLLRSMQRQGRLMLITGPAGVGKTRLVREIRLRAQMQRVLVCEGSCREQGRAPYHPWVPILGQIVSYQDASNVATLRHHRDELVTLMPQLRDFVAFNPPQNGDDALDNLDIDPEELAQLRELNQLSEVLESSHLTQVEDKQKFMETVLAFLLASDRPLMIILEDLHFADAETVALLQYLSENSANGRWLLCGVYRDSHIDSTHPLHALIAQSHRVESTSSPSATNSSQAATAELPYERLLLRSLSRGNCSELVKSMLGVEQLPPHLLTQLMNETGGNPLFIESLMQSLVGEDLLRYDGERWQIDLAKLSQTPVSIQQAAQRQLERLDEPSLDLLQWASVMGQSLDLNILADLCQLTPDQVFKLVAKAAHNHVLTANTQMGQTAYFFSTDQMRESVYETLRPEVRAARHWRVAQALRKLYGDHENLEQLAWHFEQAQDWMLALQYTKLTADKARQLYANESALQFYNNALAMLEQYEGDDRIELKYDILTGMEDCQRLLADREAQQTLISDMLDTANRLNDPRRQIQAYTRQVSLANRLGNYAEAKRAAATAMTFTYHVDDYRMEAETLNALGAACLQLGEIGRAQASHEHALQLYQDADDGEMASRLGEASSLWHLGNVSRAIEEPDEARAQYDEALAIYREIGYQRGEANVLKTFALMTDKAAEQIQYHQQAVELLQAIGDRDAQANSYYDLGGLYRKFGLYQQARYAFEQAIKLTRNLKLTQRLPLLLEPLAEVYMAMGDYGAAQPLLEEGYTQAKNHSHSRLIAHYQMLRGKLDMLRERHDQARERLVRASNTFRDLEAWDCLAICLAWLGLNALALNNSSSAHRATSEAVTRLELVDNTSTQPLQQVWWSHYQVLQVVYNWSPGEPLSDEAWTYLHRAHDAVMATIVEVDDQALQHSYLTGIALNRNIVTEWVARSSRLVQMDDDLPDEVQPNKVSLLDQVEGKLKRILEMGVQMSEASDLDSLLSYVLDQLMVLTAAERSFLALVDQSGQLEFKAARGGVKQSNGHLAERPEDAAEAESERIPQSRQSRRGLVYYTAEAAAGRESVNLDRLIVEESHQTTIDKGELSYTIIGAVMQSRSPILLQDAQSDVRFGRQDSVMALNLRSVLCVPLIARSDLIGLIYADSRSLSGCFSEEDLDIVTIFANQAAIAIENTRLYHDSLQANKALEAWSHSLEQRVEQRTAQLQEANLALIDRASQLQVTSQVAQQVTAILDLDELLNQVVRLIQSTFGYYFVGIWLPAKAPNFMTLRAGTGELGEKLQAQSFQVSLKSRTVMAKAYTSGENCTVSNIRTNDDYTALAELPSTYSELAFPLQVIESTQSAATATKEGDYLERTIGVLDIHSSQQAEFEADETRVLQLLANQVATAIRNAQLYEAEIERRELAEGLEKAGRLLSSKLNFHEAPSQILQALMAVVPYQSGLVALREDNHLRVQAHQGFSAGVMTTELALPIEDSHIFNHLNETKQPVIDDDTLGATLSWLPQNYSWVGAPLIAKGQVIGELLLTRPTMFSQDEVYTLSSFATKAGITLENARLNEHLEQSVQQRTEELNQAYHHLEQLNKTKTDFIEVTAHELRTPLTVMSGFTQMLKTNPLIKDNEGTSAALEGVLSGVERLQEVVTSMLDVAKIDAQALQMNREDTLLGIIVDRACNKFKEALAERNLTLTLDNAEGMPAVPADPQLLSKVFYNLINNAIKYTPDGGSITVSWGVVADDEQPPSMVQVIVSDTGIGIDPEHTQIIFEKFFQTGEKSLHSSGKTKFKGGGPGLGLAIVKGIVEAHNGQIWAESEGYSEETFPGSQFYVRLPLH